MKVQAKFMLQDPERGNRGYGAPGLTHFTRSSQAPRRKRGGGWWYMK